MSDLIKTLDSKEAIERIAKVIEDPTQINRFFTLVKMEMSKSEKLRTCDPISMWQCLIKIAERGLFIGTGDAYLIPYKGKCTVQLGYSGMTKLLYRAGLKTLTADVVYKNDKFSYVNGTSPKLEHTKTFGERGERVCAYAIASVKNKNVMEIMLKQELDEIKKIALSTKSDSPWLTFYDEMAKKTVIKRLFKRLPQENLNISMQEIENIDNNENNTNIKNVAEVYDDTNTITLGSDAVAQLL
jgi:recombination protein RecT